MTGPMLIVFGILAGAIALFASGRLRPDVVAILVVLALNFGGVLTIQEALAGFGEPVVALIAAVSIVGEGLIATGVAYRLGEAVMKAGGSSEARLVALVMAIAPTVPASTGYSYPDTRSTDMTGLQAELEAAFRKLPIAPPDDGRIPYEWLIPGIGRQLALMKPVDRKVASPDATKRKLVALKKHAKILCEDMSAMALLPLKPRTRRRCACTARQSSIPSVRSRCGWVQRTF
ncbi:MAG: hypothetical protein CR217_15155 [Beijerinckiaceae bacterium]|nr:MAG: hypothetical protein CR217_15155 [Beijerinckiaceae bacterium]